VTLEMLRFVARQFHVRPIRVLALGCAIVVAATSFTLLASAARTSKAQLRGTVESNYRAAYDVLVRPRASAAPLEREARLVRPNYLSGLFGGITLNEYERIKRVPGVEVAAPIANIGYILPSFRFPISIKKFVSDQPDQLYSLTSSFSAQRGLSRYPAQWRGGFVYYTTRDRFLRVNEISRIRPGAGPVIGRLQPTCRLGSQPASVGPFGEGSYGLHCYSRRSPGEGDDSAESIQADVESGFVGSLASVKFPILISAIDPVEEARLVGLDHALVAGRYLSEHDRPMRRQAEGLFQVTSIPVLAADRTFIDETLRVQVRRLQIPEGIDVGSVLSAPRDSSSPLAFLNGLNAAAVATLSYPLSAIYDRLLDHLSTPRGAAFNKYWLGGPVDYRRLASEVLAPRPVRNPLSIWRSNYDASGYEQAPHENRDLQFRRLLPYLGNNRFVGGVLATPTLLVVGRYDPSRIRGFSRLSQVPLETYYPPELDPADRRSSRLLDHEPLRPTQNIGDYIQQPPLLLTTLEGLDAFLDKRRFSGHTRSAPIAAIRIRVEDVVGPDEVSQARVRAVAERIYEETGLQVDITAGSSPHPLTIRLPQGRFGRPELVLREGWSKKGVSLSFLKALDRKEAALFSLILLIGGFYLANGALAAVRTRRTEIGTLLTVGWSPRAVFTAVLGEIVAVGVLAGMVGMLLALLIGRLASLSVPFAAALLVLPVAVSLALAAGVLPAWKASRGMPLDAVRPPVSAGGRRRRVRGMRSLALVNVTRVRGRFLVAVGGLVVGVAALTLLVAVERAFRGSVVGTVLGNALSVQVRGADFLAVGITIALAALSVADVLYINLRERAPELASLRTVGWSDHQLGLLVALEATVIGLTGSVIGAALGVSVSVLAFDTPLAPLVAAAGLSILGGVTAALAASLVPVAQLRRLAPVAVLATE
jgi:ABC-type lipoprotein release transport system permease subunit